MLACPSLAMTNATAIAACWAVLTEVYAFTEEEARTMARKQVLSSPYLAPI